MDFSSSSSGGIDGGSGSMSNDQIMSTLKQQMEIEHLQKRIQKMSEKCFLKCVPKPGSSLDNYEQKCLAMCMDRYDETFQLVATTYMNRINQEKGKLS